MKKTLAMVLAGGEGKRLKPLTEERAKPAVPFAGRYRIIDFVLSNMVNSGITDIVILPQYESASLDRHIREAWTPRGGNISEVGIYSQPPRAGKGKDWHKGTADAIFHNQDIIENYASDRIAIFGGDHIYKMDISKMIETHNGGNDLTIAAIKTPISEENFGDIGGERRFQFGVLEADKNNKVIQFYEKPKKPKEIPGEKGFCWTSMGNYIFKTKSLADELTGSKHDFGNNIIPDMINKEMNIFIYPFEGYWRDVGTIESYYKANIDLLSEEPLFDLYDRRWPIRTLGSDIPPTRLSSNNSLVSEGCIIKGNIDNCIISPNVHIGKNSLIRNSIIFNEVRIGDDVTIKNAIIDKKNIIPNNYQIGYNSEEDKKKGFEIDSGITIVPRRKLK